MYQLIFSTNGLEALLQDDGHQEDAGFLSKLALPLMQLDDQIRAAGRDSRREVRELAVATKQ
jgi:hypothetical protein